jgi:hypothetical protein
MLMMTKLNWITTGLLVCLLLLPAIFISAGEGNSRKVIPKSASVSCIISSEKMNILYADMENPVAVSANGYLASQLQLEISGGKLRKDVKAGFFMVKPDSLVTEVAISLYSKKENRVLGEKKFRVRKIRLLTLFGNKTEGATVSPEEIKIISRINVSMEEGLCMEGVSYKVTNYIFVWVPTDGDAYCEKVSGNGITPTMREKLNRSQPGDLIIISGVNASGPSGSVAIPGLSLKVQS